MKDLPGLARKLHEALESSGARVSTVGLVRSGPSFVVYLERKARGSLPQDFHGIPVSYRVTGKARPAN